MTLISRTAALIVLVLVARTAVAFELANPGFEAVEGDRPAGWLPYAWDRAQDGIAVATAGEAAAGARCLRLAATATGAVGVISAPVALGERVAVRVRLRLRPAADYAGNRPWVFLSCHRGGTYLGSAAVPLPDLAPGRWTAVDAVVPGDRLSDGLDAIRLNIATRRDGPGGPAGCLDADEAALAEDLAALVVTIACERFAAWSVAGQPATFRITAGTLGPRVRRIAAQVADSAGTVVHRDAVAAAAFAADGWSWTPALPGFYEVAFTAEVEREGAMVALPLTASYAIRAPSGRTLPFVRDRWTLAVAAAPTRPMAERSPLFGFSYQLGPEDEIRLADLIGLSFARIHAIPWGSQFADPRRAIEPERGVYRWEELDQKVGWLHQRGYGMVGNVLYTPRWASPHPEDAKIDICVPGFAAWAPTDLADWTRFLTALVGRYGDRIRTWELWNEPHLPGGSCFWHDTPERFVALLRSGYQAVKAAQPDSEVWIGGLGMRYVPFYRQLARLGGLPFFDRLALHGAWCDPAPFFAIDRAAGAATRPWVNSEQHGILLNPGGAIPDERALARRLVLDSLGQLARGAERLALFQIPEYMDKEVLEPARAEGWFIHSSGLFRARPRVEPRLPALVWHTVISQMRPGMRLRSQHRLDAVRVVALGDAAGDLLLVWSDEDTAVPEALARCAAAGGVIDWEGRPVAAWTRLTPTAMYLVRGVDPALTAALPAGEAIPPPRGAKAAAGPVPRATATWGALPADAALIPATVYVDGADREAVQAAFAVAADERTLTVRVDVRDPELVAVETPGKYWQGDSVQIAIDTGAAGIEGDQVQFIAALTASGAVVWKDAAPYIGGDLPSAWTPAGRPAAHARAEIARIDGGLRYLITVAVSELYPLVPDRGQPLRFSLLVNSNRGQGRAGWVEWGSGIGKDRDPAAYGILDWR